MENAHKKNSSDVRACLVVGNSIELSKKNTQQKFVPLFQSPQYSPINQNPSAASANKFLELQKNS